MADPEIISRYDYKNEKIEKDREGTFRITTMRGTSTPHPEFSTLALAKKWVDRIQASAAMKAHMLNRK